MIMRQRIEQEKLFTDDCEGLLEERLHCKKAMTAFERSEPDNMETRFRLMKEYMLSKTVSIEEAVKWNKKVRLRQKIKLRLKGGKIYCNVAFWFRKFAGHRDRQTFMELLRACLIFVLGGRTVNFFWKRYITEEKQRIIRRFVPQDNQVLYHWTSVEFAADIHKKGLIPRTPHQYVYLTDDPQYMEFVGFLHMKTRFYGRDTTYVALEIEAEELSKKEEIYQMLDEHEFVVKSVPPEFIRPIKNNDMGYPEDGI